MKKEIFEYIQSYLEKNANPPFEVEHKDSLNAYFDSLDKVIFFADLEERFDVKPSLDEWFECKCLSEVCELIVSKRND